MVQYHIQYDHHPPAVAFVDEPFEIISRPVVFVRSQMKGGIVAPAAVGIELHDRHQLDRIHTQPFQVVQRIDQGFIVVVGQKIPDQQFVNHQIFPVRAVKIVMLPAEGLLAGLQYPHQVGGLAGRIGLEPRIDRFGNKRVVLAVQYFLGIGIGHSDLPVHQVLKCVFGAGREVADLSPVIDAVGIYRITLHEVARIDLPVVEISYYIYEIFVGGKKREAHSTAIDIGNPISQTRGAGLVYPVGIDKQGGGIGIAVCSIGA